MNTTRLLTRGKPVLELLSYERKPLLLFDFVTRYFKSILGGRLK